MGGKRKLLRGHYNPVQWERKYPNLQWSKIPGKTGRVLVCATCIKQKKTVGARPKKLSSKVLSGK